MQLTTITSATLITLGGFAAAIPAPITNSVISNSNASTSDFLSPLEDTDITEADAAADSSTLSTRGAWRRRIRYCEKANGDGVCIVKDFHEYTGCFNFWDWFGDRISSIQLTAATTCTLYVDRDCRGDWLKVFDPGLNNLKTQSTLNDKISSIICYPRSTAPW